LPSLKNSLIVSVCSRAGRPTGHAAALGIWRARFRARRRVRRSHFTDGVPVIIVRSTSIVRAVGDLPTVIWA
jgi:hypothetical protein